MSSEQLGVSAEIEHAWDVFLETPAGGPDTLERAA